MKKYFASTAIALATVLALGCGENSKQAQEKEETSSETPAGKPVVTEQTKPAEEPAEPSAPALSTQSGPKGFQVDLTRAEVNGAILTVEFRYRNTNKNPNDPSRFSATYDDYEIGDVNYIDDNTSKKYTVLKDEQDKYMASPTESYAPKKINVKADSEGNPVNVFFRFPAPPADTKTISITVPGAGAFNGITVTRK
jgi:hypothetical protein